MNLTQKSVLLGVFIPSKNQPTTKIRKIRKINFNSLKDNPLTLDKNLDFNFTFKRRKNKDSLLLEAKTLLKEAIELEKSSKNINTINTTINSINNIINNTNKNLGTTNNKNQIPSPPNNKVEISKSPLKKKLELKPLKNLNKSNPTPTTWAKVVGKNNNKTNINISFKESINKKKVSTPPNLKANKGNSYKDQRLVLITKDKKQEFNSYILKERINKKLKNQLNTNNNIIISINKNRNNNIIITTREGYSPNILLKNQDLWKEYFIFNKAIKDRDYYNLIIHDINNKIYNNNLGLINIKKDLEKDNLGLSIIGTPKQISKKENRAIKPYSSIIISLNIEGKREKYLNKKIFIGGKISRVEKFISKSLERKEKAKD